MGFLNDAWNSVTQPIKAAADPVISGANDLTGGWLDRLYGQNSFFGGLGDAASGNWAGYRDKTLIPGTEAALGTAAVLGGGSFLAGTGAAGATGTGAAAAEGGGFFTGATPWLMGGSILSSLYSGQLQSDAIKAAAEKSAQASAMQLSMHAPYQAAGTTALSEMMKLATDPSSYRQSAYSHWLQQQGEQGMMRGAAATGGVSGGTLAELSKYAQESAGAGYTDQYNRFASLAGLGQTANTQAGNVLASNAATQGNAGMALAGVQGGTINNILNTLSWGAGMRGFNTGVGSSPATTAATTSEITPTASDASLYSLAPPPANTSYYRFR